MFEKLRKRIEALDERWRNLAEWHTEGSNAVLEFYVKILPRAADADRCNIFIHIPTREGMWLEVGTGEREREVDLLEDADPVVTEVIATGKSRIISRRHQVDVYEKTGDGQKGIGDILCIPLRSLNGKETVGAIEILEKRGGATFDDLDRESVEEVAHFLEVRLENIFFNVRPKDMVKLIFDAVNVIIVATLGTLVLLSTLLAVYYAVFSFGF